MTEYYVFCDRRLKAAAEDVCLMLKLLPLRLQISQDALDFALAHLQFVEPLADSSTAALGESLPAVPVHEAGHAERFYKLVRVQPLTFKFDYRPVCTLRARGCISRAAAAAGDGAAGHQRRDAVV